VKECAERTNKIDVESERNRDREDVINTGREKKTIGERKRKIDRNNKE
jgi:hypothetical protein